MIDAASVKGKVRLREMFAGFPVALAIYYAMIIAFTVFNLGSYLLARTPLFSAWLDFSQPFTDWVAGFLPFVADTITKHLGQTHTPQLIPIHRNVFLIDFVLIIVLIACFVVGVSIDVLRIPRHQPFIKNSHRKIQGNRSNYSWTDIEVWNYVSGRYSDVLFRNCRAILCQLALFHFRLLCFTWCCDDVWCIGNSFHRHLVAVEAEPAWRGGVTASILSQVRTWHLADMAAVFADVRCSE